MSQQNITITYTKTDEAPALATRSLFPIIKRFLDPVGIQIELKDISLAGRVLATFPEYLSEKQRINDDLGTLGKMVLSPDANIIKLPNISASVPQLKATIAELQNAGYAIPNYPENPSSDEERDIQKRYNAIKGSAVNPVLREGNADRRVAKAVKDYAKSHPHSMGAWSADSETHVDAMHQGDFYETEQSVIMSANDNLKVVLESGGEQHVLFSSIKVLEGEIIDAAVMRHKDLDAYIDSAIKDAQEKGLLLSAHLKATMMKVSDPIIFGHILKRYFKQVFETYGDTLRRVGASPNNGLKNLITSIDQLEASEKKAILDLIERTMNEGPDLAMVDSDKGITNLHVPSDIIIDASMPAMIRNSGKMWDKHGKVRDTKAMIPDRSYAGIYQETIDFCKKNGAFDPATMGSVANVGLMAQKAQEYGSHDKTIEIQHDGVVYVYDTTGNVLMELSVAQGDIFRMCQAKDEPIRDWVKLAVERARLSKNPAIFWLDSARAHDRNLIQKVRTYLADHDTSGLQIDIMDTRDAMRATLQRVKEGLDTISVTGNVLRDYLTDLFPILELGTSAKMLSIVPLMNGGGLFETGAGGSAPKHVQQLQEENHLRWDSLGEFLALGVSLEHIAERYHEEKAQILANTLSKATAEILNNRKSPFRKVGELDNRGSHFYLAMYWAKALASQSDNTEIKSQFEPLAKSLEENEEVIVNELNKAQGRAVELGGYYFPDEDSAIKVMRPSETLNCILA